MPRSLLGFCLVLGLACAGGDSSDSLSGQPFVPGGEESTAAAAESEGSSQPDSATSVAESTAASESTASLEPTSDCCTPAVAPGCTDPATEMCVCAINEGCCVQAWTVECAGIAVDGCGSTCAATTMDPSATTGEEPMQSCGELARAEGYVSAACEVNGNGACGGQGTPTSDCDFCCDQCETGNGPTCGDLAEQQGWELVNCEWNGNNACNGTGTPTCDCDFCCEVML